jgi:hypothetical protein
MEREPVASLAGSAAGSSFGLACMREAAFMRGHPVGLHPRLAAGECPRSPVSLVRYRTLRGGSMNHRKR